MPERTFRRGILARASLLVATLVFVMGGAMEPVVHANAAAPLTVAPAWDVQHPSDSGDSTHDELRCAICQALGAIALPAALSIVVDAPRSSFLPSAASYVGPEARGLRTVHARGPPQA